MPTATAPTDYWLLSATPSPTTDGDGTGTAASTECSTRSTPAPHDERHSTHQAIATASWQSVSRARRGWACFVLLFEGQGRAHVAKILRFCVEALFRVALPLLAPVARPAVVLCHPLCAASLGPALPLVV
jgi:hypothetical protein